jgi:RNA polymerase sigma-70 factor (ECF subfamily)
VTDEELVAAAKSGDFAAFDQLVRRHEAAVYRAALAALRVPEDAEEAAQDAFVRAWLSLARFRGDSSFRTWVVTIVWRRAITRRSGIVRWWRRRAPLDDAVGVAVAGGRPDESVRESEMRAHIVRAIEALTPKLRDALLLAQSGEYGYDEIAVILRVPVGTVKWRVSEARRKVRLSLAALGI